MGTIRCFISSHLHCRCPTLPFLPLASVAFDTDPGEADESPLVARLTTSPRPPDSALAELLFVLKTTTFRPTSCLFVAASVDSLHMWSPDLGQNPHRSKSAPNCRAISQLLDLVFLLGSG
ncbi:hypothetical protein NL676_033156 [Syzygium grande]|nr:hypothetical protein NL676_033156 [Syzygium grande]